MARGSETKCKQRRSDQKKKKREESEETVQLTKHNHPKRKQV